MFQNKPHAPLTAEPFLSDGAPCFRVPLTGRDAVGRFALLDGDGLTRLRQAGARALYLVTDGDGRDYVTMIRPPRGRAVTAARIVLAAPDGQCVRYVSGDRLDLRLSNLRLKEGFAPGEAHAAATEAARKAHAKVTRPTAMRRPSPADAGLQPQLAA